jgi:hypothetical protein
MCVFYLTGITKIDSIKDELFIQLNETAILIISQNSFVRIHRSFKTFMNALNPMRERDEIQEK